MPYQNRSLKADSNASQDLSLAALSHTTAYGRRWRLEGVYVKASVAITETVTVTLDSVDGSAYDSVLDSYDLVGERDYVFRPQGVINLQAGDEIKVTVTNANTTGTVKSKVKASELTA